MLEERKNNTILIGVLTSLIIIMSIGFATLSSRLTVNSEATVNQTWNIQITDISEKESSTGASEPVTSIDDVATTAVFNVSLDQPKDYAIFTVTVSNLGSIDAELKAITPTETGDEALKYTVTPVQGSEVGTTIAAGKTQTFEVKVEYLESAVGVNAPDVGAKKSLTLILDYEQI